jgi:hypothetical protein
MARIVTTQYRYKRPPKKLKPATIKVPEVVTVRDRKRATNRQAPDDPGATPQPANDDRKTRIVTTRPKRGRFGEAPDLTPEEVRRRGDAADALWRELVRRATSEP